MGDMGESLVTVDVKVGYWYKGTITQLWSLAGYKCEHMSGYPKSAFGQYTTHTKKCCLTPASYTLTCSSGPTFGWGGGNIKINGQVFCDSDALKDNTDVVETHQVDLCNGNCSDAPETFFQLEETCENGFVPEIMMAIDSSTISSAAEGISWRLTDTCSGGNYSPVSGDQHEYFDAQCCLPKGRYTLTCSASSVFTWQKSFVLINGRQYCYGSDGGESHIINMCDGVSDCPDFTSDDQGSSGGSDVSITIDGKPIITIGAPSPMMGSVTNTLECVTLAQIAPIVEIAVKLMIVVRWNSKLLFSLPLRSSPSFFSECFYANRKLKYFAILFRKDCHRLMISVQVIVVITQCLFFCDLVSQPSSKYLVVFYNTST